MAPKPFPRRVSVWLAILGIAFTALSVGFTVYGADQSQRSEQARFAEAHSGIELATVGGAVDSQKLIELKSSIREQAIRDSEQTISISTAALGMGILALTALVSSVVLDRRATSAGKPRLQRTPQPTVALG